MVLIALLAAFSIAAPGPVGPLPAPVASSPSTPTDATVQSRPEELHGEVTAVSGDRVRIRMAEEGWLPKAGRPVAISSQISGMWVPLKGNFVVVQVDADAVFAQHVGNEEHGNAAVGMRAVIDTSYPDPPQSVADYVGNRETTATVLSMAEGGSREAQHVAALSFEGSGDHDAALQWWQRASNGATERFFISYSATGRARILVIRGQYREALAVLQDAVARTRPRDDELVFSAYSSWTGADLTTAVELHVDLLTAIGDVFRRRMEAPDEASRWYGEAAEVMAAAATNGTPAPDDPLHSGYLDLLNDLGYLALTVLEDEPKAVSFFQIAARAGDKSAQDTLTRLGHPW